MFILNEELDEFTSPEDLESLKNDVEVEVLEESGFGYKQYYIDKSYNIKEQLNDFLIDFVEEPNRTEFMEDSDLQILRDAVNILDEFHVAYKRFANIKANEFYKDRKYRGI